MTPMSPHGPEQMRGTPEVGRSVGRKRELVAQFAAPLRAFLRTETGSAGLLLCATVAALAWANSPIGDSYREVWSTQASIQIGDFELRDEMRHWVNDGLMVFFFFFFFVIGMELRRQLSMGELTDPRRVMVPVLAAVAGLALPGEVLVLVEV